jgi:hypothetical protein
MKKVYLVIIIIILILIASGIYYFLKNQKPISPEQENPLIVENEITREEIMNDFTNKISDISPAKPVLGGRWYINRYWFPQGVNDGFYAEYEDGHIMRQVLITAGKKDNQLNYGLIAYFEPGENDWVLKQGEDKFLGKPLDLYEHSEELERWVKKN